MATPLTLWKAARVRDHGTLSNWYNIKRKCLFPAARDFTDVQSVFVSNFDTTEKPCDEKQISTLFTVGLKPSPEQKKILNSMLRVSNETHNLMVRSIDTDKVCSPQRSFADDDDFASVRAAACAYFINRYNGRAKLKEVGPVIREGQFRIPHIEIFDDSLHTTSFGYLKMSKNARKLPPLHRDVIVKKRPNNKFVLCIPCDPKYTRRKRKFDPDAMCSIDPGARTFATVYDPSNLEIFQVGLQEDKDTVIRPLLHQINETLDHIHTATQKEHFQERENRIGRLKKLRFKLRLFIENIHLTLASFLVKNYRKIILGYIPKQKNDETGLSIWKHDRFRARLLHRAKADPVSEVITQDEYMTSKTCGMCGSYNKLLKGKKVFVCSKCPYQTHRDVNGARNILLKWLNMFPFSGKK